MIALMEEPNPRLAQLIADGKRFQKLMKYAHEVPAGTAILIAPPGRTKQQVERSLRSAINRMKVSK